MIATRIPFLALLARATASPLVKRDDDDYAIPEPAIVLLIMLGAGLLVVMGYAIHATFGFKKSGNAIKQLSPEQQEYMAGVRVMNMNALMAEGAKSHRGDRRRGEVVYD